MADFDFEEANRVTGLLLEDAEEQLREVLKARSLVSLVRDLAIPLLRIADGASIQLDALRHESVAVGGQPPRRDFANWFSALDLWLSHQQRDSEIESSEDINLVAKVGTQITENVGQRTRITATATVLNKGKAKLELRSSAGECDILFDFGDDGMRFRHRILHL